jgi:phosphoribosylformylglycinamidine synthase
MKAIVTVGLKPGVLDTEGKAVAGALNDLGFASVVGARVGKVIELELTAQDHAAAEAEVKAMCEQLLANPVIETYAVKVE